MLQKTEQPEPRPTEAESIGQANPQNEVQVSSRQWVGLGMVIIPFWLVLTIGLCWIFWNYNQDSPTANKPLPPAATNEVLALLTEATDATNEVHVSYVTMVARPTPVPTSTPAPPPGLTEATLAFERVLKDHNPDQVQNALDLLARVDTSDPNVAAAVEDLRSQIYYALDALNGTVYLDSTNTARWKLVTAYGHSLIYPIDLTINRNSVYILDSGTLYRGELSTVPHGGGQLVLNAILTPDMLIGGYPVKEIVAVEATNSNGDVFVLDKSSDIYRYEIGSGMWRLEKPLSDEYTGPSPLYLNLGTYSDRLYILDPARNQIWRHPPNEQGVGFLPGTLPWLLNPGEADVSNSVDLTIDGQIYTLGRDGTIVAYAPAETLRFNIAAADELSHVQGFQSLPTQPAAIFTNVEGVSLYVADPGHRRVVALDRRNGALLRQFIAPNNLDFAALHSVAEKDGRLYMLAGASLYGYDFGESITNTLSSLTGQLPVLEPLPLPNLSPGDLQPNDPRLPLLLSGYNFTMPLKGALLPDRSAIYPGSRRAYRYGVHEGIDFYSKDIGVEVEVGTPVYAAGDGVILRADTDYQEMSLDEVNGLLETATAAHITMRETLAKLGGRQIWIDHGEGVVTRYSHLSGIAVGIVPGQPVKAGQVIGYVGGSGTPDGISGGTQFAHLHFEIRTGAEHQHYLGQWLTIEETRRAFEKIFKVPVRPAYLDFQEN